MTPEQLADAILRAAGSKLEHYTPQSKERIIEAAWAGMGTRWNLSRRALGWPDDIYRQRIAKGGNYWERLK